MNKVNNRSSVGNKALYILASLAILTGFVLTILSLMEVCTSACVEGHKYKLYGLKFEYFGLLFFIPLTLCHFIGRKKILFRTIASYLLAAGVGGELCFIFVQKYYIGQWCPVCLGIAASVLVAALAYLGGWFSEIKQKDQKTLEVNFMKHGTFSFATIVLGFIMAFVGITKFDPLEAAQESLKNSINFGDTSSPIEVYVFTDWFCTACHEAEPEFEKFAENINGKAKLFFIDANIHDESMNFTPYNLSFMIYNKPEYFELRNSLFNISERTDSPNDNMIQKEVSTLGVNFKDLNYRDIALATKLFNKLKKQFAVTSTPTVIIINLDTKKGKKISGSDDITETNILKAISDLN